VWLSSCVLKVKILNRVPIVVLVTHASVMVLFTKDKTELDRLRVFRGVYAVFRGIKAEQHVA